MRNMRKSAPFEISRYYGASFRAGTRDGVGTRLHFSIVQRARHNAIIVGMPLSAAHKIYHCLSSTSTVSS